MREYLDVCKSGDYSLLEKFVQDFIHEAYSISQFFDQLNDVIIADKELSNKQKSQICDKLGVSCVHTLSKLANLNFIITLGVVFSLELWWI